MTDFYVISGPALLETLRRAHDGENPDMLLLEVLANSDTERVDPS